MQNYAGAEIVSAPLGEVPQSAEVVGPNGGCSFNLDADDVAPSIFEYGVDLDLIPGPVVEEPNFFLAPGQLAGQLLQHEPFEERTELTGGPQDAASVRADLVCGDA